MLAFFINTLQFSLAITKDDPFEDLKRQVKTEDRRANSAKTSSKMKTKVMLVCAILLLVGSFVTESNAFTAGGGGNLPRGFGKREKEVSCCFQNGISL